MYSEMLKEALNQGYEEMEELAEEIFALILKKKMSANIGRCTLKCMK